MRGLERGPAVDLAIDFLRVFKAKHQARELDEEICLWLDILELVLFISYQYAGVILSCPPMEKQSMDSQIVARRRYWFSVREDKCRVTEEEHGIYSTWNNFCIRSHQLPGNKLPHPQRTLVSVGPLFFAISAQIASFLDQGISEKWVELAAQFMLQTALESLMTHETKAADNLLVTAFAWGWIPPSHWDHYCQSGRDKGGEGEAMINEMFENNRGRGTGEQKRWQETRLKYLSLFDVPQRDESSNDRQAERLRDIAKQYPRPEFEKKLMIFSRDIWEMCRKPILVQIEEGKVEGMSDSEFEEFKGRIFPC